MFATIQLAWFLAVRYIRRSSLWQTLLIVFVMTLTYINLVFVGGVLLGLPEGAVSAYRDFASGDVLISKFPQERFIQNSAQIESFARAMPEVKAVSARYIAGGEIEVNFRETVNRPEFLPDSAGARFVGVDVESELAVAPLHTKVIEGRFLREGDVDAVVLGANLLARYLPADFGVQTISDIYPGDTLRIKVGGVVREVTLVGLVKVKAGSVDSSVYMPARELRQYLGRTDYNAGEIALRLHKEEDRFSVVERLRLAGFDDHARIQTYEEAVGSFLDDIRSTFSVLSNVIGGIGLVVASITIFIVIFIMAIVRRKYIGILKAIGVTGFTIELSYIFLSIFYAFFGIVLGVFFVYGALVPYFAQNPIDFPFSDGILVVSFEGTLARAGLLFLTTLIAGYIPARMIVKKNALDAILGR